MSPIQVCRYLAYALIALLLIGILGYQAGDKALFSDLIWYYAIVTVGSLAYMVWTFVFCEDPERVMPAERTHSGHLLRRY